MTGQPRPGGDDAEAIKRELRRQVRARRGSLSQAERTAAAAALAEHLIDLVRGSGARTIACYLPLESEPDPSGLLDWALDAGITVLLPVSRADGALEWARHSAAAPRPGRHGILEPVGDRLPPEAIGDAELLLIPACAVDDHGTRLGWGLGYYDRALLRANPAAPVYAVVFADDLEPSLPREDHDIPVNGVVTEASVRRFESE